MSVDAHAYQLLTVAGQGGAGRRVLLATAAVAVTVAGLAVGVSPAEARLATNHNEVMVTSA